MSETVACETKENNEGIIQGHFDGTLTRNGLTQAKQLSESLRDIKISKIYSSDLSRAVKTAKIIGKPHNLTPETSKELRERCMGVWEGKRKEDLGLKGYIMGLPQTPEGGETLEQLYYRAAGFLKKLERLDQETKHHETILIVSHNGMIKAIISAMKQLGPAGITVTPDLMNTAVKYAEYKKSAWTIS